VIVAASGVRETPAPALAAEPAPVTAA
jgi:hypothetical protein